MVSLWQWFIIGKEDTFRRQVNQRDLEASQKVKQFAQWQKEKEWWETNAMVKEDYLAQRAREAEEWELYRHCKPFEVVGSPPSPHITA